MLHDRIIDDDLMKFMLTKMHDNAQRLLVSPVIITTIKRESMDMSVTKLRQLYLHEDNL